MRYGMKKIKIEYIWVLIFWLELFEREWFEWWWRVVLC